MTGRSIFAGACVLLSAACGTQDFVASPEDDSGADGPVVGTDGAADALSDDGGTRADAAPPPVDGGSTWCSTQPKAIFCADFDETNDVAALASSWTTSSSVNGSFSLDNGGGVPSAPNALNAKGQNSAQVLLLKQMPPALLKRASMRLELDLRIDKDSDVNGLAPAVVAALVFGTKLTEGVVAFAIGKDFGVTKIGAITVEPASADAGLAGSKSAYASNPAPAPGAWLGRWALEVTYSDGGSTGRTGCVQIYNGPTPQLPQCLALPASLAKLEDVSIAVGVFSGGLGNTGDVGVRFDDVVFTRE